MFAAYLIFGSILIIGFCWLVDMAGSWSVICVGIFGVAALIVKQFAVPKIRKKNQQSNKSDEIK